LGRLNDLTFLRAFLPVAIGEKPKPKPEHQSAPADTRVYRFFTCDAIAYIGEREHNRRDGYQAEQSTKQNIRLFVRASLVNRIMIRPATGNGERPITSASGRAWPMTLSMEKAS
jgi:hypothetical protein